MIGRRDGARISVNKLGEYITSKAARQKSILYNQKYPPDYVTPFYDDASDAISLFIAGGMEKPSILENQIKVLGQDRIGTTWQCEILGDLLGDQLKAEAAFYSTTNGNYPVDKAFG